jgi:uncharacterized protein (UPF0297 family)
MKTRLICALLLFSVWSPTYAREDPPPESDEFYDFLTYYYLEKDTESVIKWLKQLQDSRTLEEHESAINPIVGFLSVIFSENPAKVERFAKSAAFSGKAKEAVQTALWFSGHAETIGEVFGETPTCAKAKRVGLKKWRIEDAGDLDMMWGAFLASGDVAYVRRVIDVLDKEHELSGDEIVASATRKSAEWPLQSNMMQHELVYRVVREEAETRSGGVKKKLRRMIAAAKPAGSLPEKNGGFSAMLLLMEEQRLAEFSKPTDAPLRLDPKKTAKRGDNIAIKIVFAGIELSEDLQADVEYDLKILDPDGKIYDETDLSGLKALSRKVPTRFRIFDNQDVVMIRFDPKDKAGTYKVIAKIRDKIADKTIPLKAEIELRE